MKKLTNMVANSGACGLPGLRRAFYAGAVSAAVQKKPTKEYIE